VIWGSLSEKSKKKSVWGGGGARNRKIIFGLEKRVIRPSEPMKDRSYSVRVIA